MRENDKLSNVIMWTFRFGAVYVPSHIKQSHQSQFKKIILSETPCRWTGSYCLDRDVEVAYVALSRYSGITDTVHFGQGHHTVYAAYSH